MGNVLFDDVEDGHSVCSCRLLDESQIVADSEPVFEVNARAAAYHFALAHDSDSVAEVVCLVHEVSGEDDDSVVFVCFEKFPNIPSR